MGRRSDKKHLDELGEHLAEIILDRLTSGEFRELLALAERGGVGMTETLAKFYKTQYGIVCRETANYARSRNIENLFRVNEVSLFDLGFRAAVGAVHGDGLAESALQAARRLAVEELVSPGGLENPGPLLYDSIGFIIEIDRGLQARVDVRAHEGCCIMRLPDSGQVVDHFRWSTVNEYGARRTNPSELLVHYKGHRALAVSAADWKDVLEKIGLEFCHLDY